MEAKTRAQIKLQLGIFCIVVSGGEGKNIGLSVSYFVIHLSQSRWDLVNKMLIYV